MKMSNYRIYIVSSKKCNGVVRVIFHISVGVQKLEFV